MLSHSISKIAIDALVRQLQTSLGPIVLLVNFFYSNLDLDVSDDFEISVDLQGEKIKKIERS